MIGTLKSILKAGYRRKVEEEAIENDRDDRDWRQAYLYQ
jgi:hypothetical protein